MLYQTAKKVQGTNTDQESEALFKSQKKNCNVMGVNTLLKVTHNHSVTDPEVTSQSRTKSALVCCSYKNSKIKVILKIHAKKLVGKERNHGRKRAGLKKKKRWVK